MAMSGSEPKDIDAYIASYPPEVQQVLQETRRRIHRVAPEAEEDIRYQIPTFRLHDRNLIHFAGYERHLGVYPRPAIADAALAERLARYEHGKGTFRFPLNEPIPYDLIEQIVRLRVQETEGQARASGRA